MKNNMKKFLSTLLAVLMMASMSVTAFAAEGDFTDDTMTGGNDFNYVVVTKDVYTDISGVKLSWSVPVVKYTETNTLTWNTTVLKWEQTNSTSTTDNEVSFTLANYGSYAVKANVSFTPDVEDSASVTYGKEIDDPDSNTEPKAKKTINENDPTLATIVKDDHTLQVTKGELSDADFAAAKTKYIADNCTATISGTVTLVADKLTATSGKLGTYTVSIRNTVHTVTVVRNTDEGEYITTYYTVNDGDIINVSGSNLTINGETVSSGTTGWAYVLPAIDKIEDGDITVNKDLALYYTV